MTQKITKEFQKIIKRNTLEERGHEISRRSQFGRDSLEKSELLVVWRVRILADGADDFSPIARLQDVAQRN